MLPSQFYNLTPKEFSLTCEGYKKKQQKFEALLRKHGVFIVSAWGVKPEIAFQAWTLEGEEAKKINPKLLKRLMDYKARDIIARKELEYSKALKKWQKDSN